MSVVVACPKCQKKLKIEDSALGKNIKCPGCATVFATKASAGAAAPPPAKTAPAAPRKAAPPPDEDDEDEAPRRPAKAAPKAVDDDDDDDRPKKPAAKKSRDDDEDDRPKKSAAKKGRASDDDDDEDDRPAKKGKKKGSGGKVLLIVGTIVLLLCGGCGGLGYWGYVKLNEAGNAFVGAMTDLGAKMATAGGESKEPLTKAKPATFPPGWKEFKEPKYGFSVWMPGTPQANRDNNDERGQFELPVPQQPAGAPKSGYWIKVNERPGADGSPLSTRLTLELLVGEGGLHVVGPGQATNIKSGLFAGKPGRAWDVPDDKGGVWHFRACLSGTKGYILGVGPDAKVSPNDADTFFSSFELVGPGDKPEGPKPATQKAEGPKPGEQPKFASEQQLADAMVDNSTLAMQTYGFLLQLQGKVTKVTLTPDGKVNEIFFEPQVEDLKTHVKKPFPINCRIPKAVLKSKAAVGQTVTVRGNLTGGGKDSATLNECVLVP